MFDFADRFNKLNLTDEEIAIFSAIVLLSPGIKSIGVKTDFVPQNIVFPNFQRSILNM